MEDKPKVKYIYRFRRISQFLGERNIPVIDDERFFSSIHSALIYREEKYGEEIEEIEEEFRRDQTIRFYPINVVKVEN